MRIETMLIIITGIVCITVLEVVAIANGINGVAFAGAIAAISVILTGTFTFLITKAKIKKGGQ